MSDQEYTVRMKVISDISDAKSNVDALQKSFSKLKLPDNIGDKLSKNISEFYKEYDKFQKKTTEGVKTQADYNQVEKSLNRLKTLYEEIGKSAGKVSGLDLKGLVNTDTGVFKQIKADIDAAIASFQNFKFDDKVTSGLSEAVEKITSITKNTNIVGENGILNKIIGEVNSKNIEGAKQQLQELMAYAERVAPKTYKKVGPDGVEKEYATPGTLNTQKYSELLTAIQLISRALQEAGVQAEPLNQKIEQLKTNLDNAKSATVDQANKAADAFIKQGEAMGTVVAKQKQLYSEEFNSSRQIQNLDRQVQSYFGLTQILRKVIKIGRQAFKTVKDLDAAMTETAVVTNYDVGDMWNMLPMYTEQANKLGSTIKDVYAATTLYYQQGLNSNQAMGLATETLKMARIAGLEAKDATDAMTAALRGFNMEINQMSAQRVNDVYSNLAANTASNVEELSTAMEKVAALANSAGMEFETTSAFLAQMIETTREAPENLGTALKTIIARFQEMKKDPTKLVDSEGVAMDVNKVDTALKSIGVSLTDVNGEFRNLDDVFLEISAKWDTLTMGQQRYIATMAAGSRQQSRFIAMMSNYGRTMELIEYADNSAGASNEQFEKTLEGLDAKLNKLKNAWDQFTMGLMNNTFIKLAVDTGTKILTVINGILSAIGKLPGPLGGVTKSLATLGVTIGMLNFGKKFTSGLIGGGVASFNGGSFTEGFQSRWDQAAGAKEAIRRDDGSTDIVATKATRDAQFYKDTFAAELSKSNGLFSALQATFNAKPLEMNDIIKAETFDEAFINNRTIEQIKNMSPQVEDALRSCFQQAIQNSQTGENQMAEDEAQALINSYISRLRAGEITVAEAKAELIAAGEAKGLKIDFSTVDAFKKGMGDNSGAVDEFKNSLTEAGSSLTIFGSLLRGTPLAPFGAALTKIGRLLSLTGRSFSKFATNYKDNLAKLTSTQPINGKKEIAITNEQTVANGANAASEEIKAEAKAESAVAAEAESVGEEAASVATGENTVQNVANTASLWAKAQAAWAALGPLMQLVIVLGALYAIYKLIDFLHESTAEKLEKASAAADAAADAYDNLKQSVSELKDAIESLNGLDSSFDELVKGSKEFYENIIETNEAVSELIDKYPELAQYVTFDENGRMSISEGRLNDYYAQLQEKQTQALALKTAESNQVSLLQKQLEYEEAKNARDMAGTDWARNDIEVKRQQQRMDALQAEMDAQKELNSIMVSRTALSGKDLKNADAIAALYADQYENRKKTAELKVEGLTSAQRRQKYADYYGYTVEDDKIYDQQHNEVDIDDDVIKSSLADMDVIANLSINAEEADKQLSILGQNLGKKIGDGWDSDVLNQILSSDITIDPDKLQTAIDTGIDEVSKDFTHEQVAIILGIDVEKINDSNWEAYQKQATEKLKKDAEAIQEAQEAAFAETRLRVGTGFDNLSSEQKSILANNFKKLQEQRGGAEATEFVRQLSNIYNDSNVSDEQKQRVNEIISSISWEDPISQLEAYQQLQNETFDGTQELADVINEMSDGNLLTESVSQFYSSQDYADLAENMDDFVDSTGKINAVGVKEMAKESAMLNRLLESGAISAGGMANVLNSLNAGDISIFDLNDRIIKLIDSFNQLDNVVAETHSLIENFDAGVDTGEAEDFLKDSIKTWKEYYDNGEWGNPQMEAYAKLIIGQEKWDEAVKASGGDMEQVYKSLYSDMMMFSDGAYDAWVEFTKQSPDMAWVNADGSIHLETDKGTQGIIEELTEQLGITEEAAKLMLEEYLNYSGDLRTELAQKDFEIALKDKKDGFFANATTDKNGNYVVTEAEIKTLAASQGVDEQEIRDAITASLDDNEGVVYFNNLDDDGKLITDGEELNKRFTETVEGGGGTYGWLKRDEGIKQAKDLGMAIEKLERSGVGENQQMQMLYDAYKQGQLKDFTYLDQELPGPDEFNSLDEFTAWMQQANDLQQWTTIGDVLGKAVGDVLREYLGLGPTEEEANEYGETIAEAASQIVDNTEETETERREAREEQRREERPNLAQREAREQQPQQTQPSTPSQSYQSRKLEQIAPESTSTTNTITTVEEQVTKVSGEIDPTAQQAVDMFKKLNEEAEKERAVKVSADLDSSFNTVIDTIETITNKTITLDVDTKDAASKVAEVANKIAGISGKSVDLTANATQFLHTIANLTAKLIALQTQAAAINISRAKGQNQPRYYGGIPTAGSAARGRGGRIGPKGAGGLTLTGEEGYEIAWLPNEQRSVILGAGGPQMTNLPANAVVWDHKESEEILKRKGISAGSMATGYRGKQGVTGGGSSSKPKTKSSSTVKGSGDTQVIINFSMEEVKRYNYEKQIEHISDTIDIKSKELQKLFDKIGTQVSTISGNVNAQRDALNSVKTYNEKLANSFKADLKNLDTGNYKEKISWSSGGKKNSEDVVNLSSYIKNVNGVYQIDVDKLNAEKDRAKREAIYKAAQSALDSLVNGYNKAVKAAQDAQDKIDELDKQVGEMFYTWENELTKLYELNQKMANIDSMKNRFGEQIQLELTKVNAGYQGATAALTNLTQVQSRYNTSLQDQLAVQKNIIAENQKNLDNAFSYADEAKDYEAALKTGNQAAIDKALNDLNAAKLMNSYLSSVKKNDDGTYSYELNEAQLEADRLNGKISKETYEAIKAGYDNLGALNQELNNSMSDFSKTQEEIFKQLIDYKKDVADLEDDLIKGLEEQQKQEIDNAKKLSDTFKNSIKNLLDGVKKKLDDRRKKEDNEKTEQEISNKQQRLAMLRADTSGGHEFEIAQLEQEIAESTQSYERTLEDQLLESLQSQADKAEEQRTRQIELAQMQLDIQSLTGENIAKVNEWLSNPRKQENLDQMREILLKSENYEEKGYYGQELARDEVEGKLANGLFALDEIQKNSKDQKMSTKELADKIDKDYSDLTTSMNTDSGSTSVKASNAAVSKDATVNAYSAALKSVVEDKKIDKQEFLNIKDIANAAGFGAKRYIEDLVKNGLGWEKVLRILKEVGYSQGRIALTWGDGGKNKTFVQIYEKVFGKGSYAKNRAAAIKKNYKAYASGGLANYTGPAWLDGTPAKPELVLNAQDTKNFIALRDVLSKAIGSTKAIENSYGGDAVYEININVDHLNNDYDVDKVAERVKKIIVKDSSYRNVTQVRKFR